MSIDTVLGTQERIAEIIGNLDSIATLPEVVARITSTVNDPRSTPGDLYHIISHDPSLVAKILKLVNSSFYSRASEIHSVERAITLLGFETIHHLAIAATMGQLFKNVKLCDGYTAKDLWTHSIAVAAAAREMAKLTYPELSEEVFLAGLVHDVGMLVALQVRPEKLRTVCERAKTDSTSFTGIELAVTGVDHQELGAALARKWGFPPACRIVARNHHYPMLADEPWRPIAAIVHAADALCCQAGIGFDLTAKNELADEAGFQGLVPFSAIEHVSENLRSLVDPAIQMFH
ncbi:MAG TPA: HDOD domain-containing protein [Tepidisphaeraceae bacterium]|nr:HDOD domain-containing protein [Tepidisphaeraceae bacterium]